jgi:hypothetical protein
MSEPISHRATRYEFREQHLPDMLQIMTDWIKSRTQSDSDIGTIHISYNTTIGYWHASLYLRENG